MTSRGSNKSVVGRKGNRYEVRAVMTVDLPFGKLGSSGCIERLDFTTLGYGEEPAVGRPHNGSDCSPAKWVLDGDELVTIITVKYVDGVQASSGDVSTIWGELDSLDLTVMFEWANQSLPSRDAPDVRFPPSRGSKPGRLGRDVDCFHIISVLHLDDLSLQLCVPHVCALNKTTYYPLAIPRHMNGVQVHPRLLSHLLTICKSPSSNPILRPAEKMHSVRVESD